MDGAPTPELYGAINDAPTQILDRAGNNWESATESDSQINSLSRKALLQTGFLIILPTFVVRKEKTQKAREKHQ